MQKLASITILSTNRQGNASRLSEVLSKYGQSIMSRMGVNVEMSCTDHCTGLILLALKGKEEDFESLLKDLNEIEDLKAKISYV
jgi:ACT domain-containing protein